MNLYSKAKFLLFFISMFAQIAFGAEKEPETALDDATARCVNTGSVEYVFFHRASDGKIESVSKEEYDKIYEILLQYQFPMCITNQDYFKNIKFYDEEKTISDAINEQFELNKVEKIAIQKTVYNLFFILALITTIKDTPLKEQKNINQPFPLDESIVETTPKFHTETLSDYYTTAIFKFRCQWDEQKYLQEHRIFLKSDWIIGKHLKMNDYIVKYLNTIEYNSMEPSVLAQNLINKIHEVQKEISNACNLEHENKFTDLRSSGYEYIVGLQYYEGFKVKAPYKLDLENPYFVKIILDSVEAEKTAHEHGFFTLYRGVKLGDNGLDLFLEDNKPISLSYGSSLFSGLIREAVDTDAHNELFFRTGGLAHFGCAGAVPFLYISKKGGYILQIPVLGYLKNDISRYLFFIPPVTTFLSFYLKGENFHPRSKIFIAVNQTWKAIKHISGSESHLPIEYLLADKNYFSDLGDFEAKLCEFWKSHVTTKWNEPTPTQ